MSVWMQLRPRCIRQVFCVDLITNHARSSSGSRDKHEIVVNRIVATLTGVLMALILQLIPPHAKGDDPDRI